MVMEDCGSSIKALHDSKGIDLKEAEERRKREECNLIKEKCFSPSREKKNSEITEAVPSVKTINLKNKNHLTKLDIQLIKAEISRLIDPCLSQDDRKRLDMVLQYVFKSCNVLFGRQSLRPFPSSQEIGASNLFDPLQTSDTNLTEKVIENRVAEIIKKVDKLTTPFLPEDTRKKLNKVIVSILSNDFMNRDSDSTPVKNKGILDTNLGTLHQDDVNKTKDTSSTENCLNMLPVSHDNAVSDTGQNNILSETQNHKPKHRYYLTETSKEDTPANILLDTISLENTNVHIKPDLNLPSIDQKIVDNSTSPVVEVNVSASEQHGDTIEMNTMTASNEPQLSSPVSHLNKEPLKNENTLSLLNIAPCEHQYSFPGPDSNMTPPSDEAFAPEVFPNKIVLSNDSSNEGHNQKSYDSVEYTKEELEIKDPLKMGSHHPSHLYTIKSYLTSEENTALLGQPLAAYNTTMLPKNLLFNAAYKTNNCYAPTILTDEEITEILSEIDRQTSGYLPPNKISKLKTDVHRVLTIAANENASVDSNRDGTSFNNLPDNVKYLVENVDACFKAARSKNENVGRYINRQSVFYGNNRSYCSSNSDGNKFSQLNKGGKKFFDPDNGNLTNRPPKDTNKNPKECEDGNDMAMVKQYSNNPEELELSEKERINVHRQELFYAIERFLEEISPREFNTSSIQETMEALKRQGQIEFIRDFFKNELFGLSATESLAPRYSFPPPTAPKCLCSMPATSFCASFEGSLCRPRLPSPPGAQPRITSCSPPPFPASICPPPGQQCPSEPGPLLAPGVPPCRYQPRPQSCQPACSAKPPCPPPKPACPPPKPPCPPPKPACPPPKPSCPPPKPKPCPPKPSCPPPKPKCPPPKPSCPPPKPKCPPPSKPKCASSKPKRPKKPANKCPPKEKKPSCKPKCIKSPSYKLKKRCYRQKRKILQLFKKHESRPQTTGSLTKDIGFTDIIKLHFYKLYRRIIFWLKNLSGLGTNAVNFREFDPWLPIPYYEGPPADPVPCRTKPDPPIELPAKPNLKPWYIYTPPTKDLPQKPFQ